MADLIDRQALRKALLIGAGYLDEDTLMTAVNVLDCAPTVDAEEVVRCKDCKHYKRGIVFKDTMFCYRPDEGGDTIIRIFKDNDFCSYGERRGDDA